MQKIKDLFEAEAASPLGTVMLYGSNIGFVIPEYQRQYDWKPKDIERLYFDTLNGFYKLRKSANANAFTFLGTLILVEERTKEDTFQGTSVAVVDGQQRLTTLALLACALTEALRRQYRNTEYPHKISPEIRRWIDTEVKDRETSLYTFAIGSQRVSATSTYPFPRLIRQGDNRGGSGKEAEYDSPIGNFLNGFASFFDSDDIHYQPPPPKPGTETAAKKLVENFEILRGFVLELNNSEWYEDSECDQFNVAWAGHGHCRTLFERLRDCIREEADQHRAIGEITKHDGLHGLVRTLLFSAYFCNCIVLTRVLTRDRLTVPP